MTISMSNVGLEGLAVVVVGIESRNFVEHARPLFSNSPSEVGISTDLLHFQ